MNLLYLTSYYHPERIASSHLDRDRDEALAHVGIRTVVYTPTPTRGISADVRKHYRWKHTEQMQGGAVTVHRFPIFGEGRNVLLRALRYLLVCICQFFLGCFASDARRCSALLVFSTPPIQGAMAALVKMVRGIPFIYGLQDIFPDSLVSTGIAKKDGLAWKVGRIIENLTYRHADKIIVISEDFKQNIMAKGVPEEKIEIVYNWVDEQAVVPIERKDNVLFSRYGLNPDFFYLYYAGNIGLTQNMDGLLHVMEELQHEHPDIHLVLVGDGVYINKVKEIIADRQLRNVHLLPFQPYEEIAHVFSLGDVGLVISKPGVGANSVPSKTWSIMAAGRPVIACFDANELRTIVEQNHCGVFVPAGDMAAFKAAVLRLYQDRWLCRQMGGNGRQFVLNNLTKEAGTEKYVRIIRSINNNS
jgi:glycosyltransferase involved in cell wall biosynthesis